MSPPPTRDTTMLALPPWMERFRAPVLFVGGLAGMVHQTAFADEPSAVLVVAFLGLLGLPMFGILDRMLRPSSPSDPEQTGKDATR